MVSNDALDVILAFMQGLADGRHDDHYGALCYVEALVRDIRRLIEALERQRGYWLSLPSGVEDDPDPDDPSPEDAVAHTAGLAIRDLDEVLTRELWKDIPTQ